MVHIRCILLQHLRDTGTLGHIRLNGLGASSTHACPAAAAYENTVGCEGSSESPPVAAASAMPAFPAKEVDHRSRRSGAELPRTLQ